MLPMEWLPAWDSYESRILMPFMHESTFIHLSDS